MSRKDTSFAALMKNGWTKEQLMKHFCMDEGAYERAKACVERIEAQAKPQQQQNTQKTVCQCGNILENPKGEATVLKCKCGRYVEIGGALK